MDFTNKQMNIINEYCKNDAKKLIHMVYPLISNLGGVYQKDYDDLYSKSSALLLQLAKTYDESQGVPFDIFFRNCLKKRLSTYAHRDANRGKRRNIIELKDEFGNPVLDEKGNPKIEIIQDISFDEPLSEDGGTLKDIVEDKNNPFESVEESIFSEKTEGLHPEVKEYLNNLSPLQRSIIQKRADGFKKEEICKDLHITSSHYNNSLNRIMASERIEPLRALVERD